MAVRTLTRILHTNLPHGSRFEFKLYLIKEFQRLKDDEHRQLGWDIRRNLAKINERIHTDAVKENLMPAELTRQQITTIYASEADVLNVALFGITAKEWREANADRIGNIRDYADISQLVCLSNLESLNALFIGENLPQADRLVKLNTIAIHQMRLLTDDVGIRKIGSGDYTKERKQWPGKDFDTVMAGIKDRRKKKIRK